MSDTQASRDPGNTDDYFEQVDHRQTEDDKKAVPLIQEQRDYAWQEIAMLHPIENTPLSRIFPELGFIKCGE